MTASAKDLVNGIVEELDGLSGLPHHSTIKYRRPYAVLPGDCPLLCVWLVTKSLRLITTEMFESTFTIGVSWQVESVESSQTLIVDEEKQEELLESVELIEEKLREMGLRGSPVPGLTAYELFPVSTDYIPAEVETGLVEGYLVSVVVNTTD